MPKCCSSDGGGIRNIIDTCEPSKATWALQSNWVTVVNDCTGIASAWRRVPPLVSPTFIPSNAWECSIEMRTGLTFSFWNRRTVPDLVFLWGRS